MTNHAPVTQRKLAFQVRSEWKKVRVSPRGHQPIPSLFLSFSFDIFVRFRGSCGQTGADQENVFAKFDEGRCLLPLPFASPPSYSRSAMIIGDTDDYSSSSVENYHCRVRYYRTQRGGWHLSTLFCVRVFTSDTFVCCCCARDGRREKARGKAKDQNFFSPRKRERKKERKKERKGHASGKEAVCIIDGCKGGESSFVNRRTGFSRREEKRRVTARLTTTMKQLSRDRVRAQHVRKGNEACCYARRARYKISISPLIASRACANIARNSPWRGCAPKRFAFIFDSRVYSACADDASIEIPFFLSIGRFAPINIRAEG